MLSEKRGKNRHCLKHQLEVIYFRLSELLIQGDSHGMKKPGAFKLSLFTFILCSTTDVMVNNGIARRNGKKGKEVNIPGFTICRVNQTNTPSSI